MVARVFCFFFLCSAVRGPFEQNYRCTQSDLFVLKAFCVSPWRRIVTLAAIIFQCWCHWITHGPSTGCWKHSGYRPADFDAPEEILDRVGKDVTFPNFMPIKCRMASKCPIINRHATKNGSHAVVQAMLWPHPHLDLWLKPKPNLNPSLKPDCETQTLLKTLLWNPNTSLKPYFKTRTIVKIPSFIL